MGFICARSGSALADAAVAAGDGQAMVPASRSQRPDGWVLDLRHPFPICQVSLLAPADRSGSAGRRTLLVAAAGCLQAGLPHAGHRQGSEADRRISRRQRSMPREGGGLRRRNLMKRP